jgi:2-methylaconitate cis-trans-isomerase PrpF
MMSMGQPHRAVPVTGAICLAVAARIPGSIPYALCRTSEGPIRIGQPSGVTLVDAKIIERREVPGGVHVEYGAVYRTARRLFDGYAYYQAI